ncbi:MAG: hypothetical protein JWR74_3192 [Polaromonas sp.]|nr:hypothetical protein [Polaromonas sp.]
MATLLPATSTAWTLTASEICTDALEHMGILADGETASSGDMHTALKALDGVLKELPLHGYCWPALSAATPLNWAGDQVVSLPDDYYAYPAVWSSVSGAKVQLVQLTHAQWLAVPDRSATGTATHCYVDPLGDLCLWPVPAVDPVLSIQYQRVVLDALLVTPPALPQYWINPLGYGVANELVLKFSVPQDKRLEIAQRWNAKKDRALESSIASEAICFSVAD